MLKFIRLMTPIRPISALWRLCFFLFSFSAFQLVSFSQDAPDEPEPEPAPAPVTDADHAYQRFRGGTLDVRTLAEVLPQMADPDRRTVIRSTLIEAKSPPRADLVALLQHPALAVRLGALELLEELAGGDFSYNPWLPADSPENLAAFARWKTWTGNPAATRADTSLYSMEQRRGYLRDILGEDADKASRARRMLEAEGFSALGFLESFLTETPTLTTGARAKIREAQYQITLTRQLGDQAAITARHLAFGSRDQLLAALAATRSAGLLALPILRDFITHADPLVRETAIDSLLIVGGEHRARADFVEHHSGRHGFRFIRLQRAVQDQPVEAAVLPFAKRGDAERLERFFTQRTLRPHDQRHARQCLPRPCAGAGSSRRCRSGLGHKRWGSPPRTLLFGVGLAL